MHACKDCGILKYEPAALYLGNDVRVSPEDGLADVSIHA